MTTQSIPLTPADDPPGPASSAARAPKPERRPDETAAQARLLALLTGIALAALVVARAAELAGAPAMLWRGLYVVAYLTGGYSGVVNGLAALRRGMLDVNILMIIAALGAAALGDWLEGGVLLFLFSLSETLQVYALGRTKGAVRALMDLRPDQATRREGEALRVVPVEALQPGDVVVVRPGERLPADGRIARGESDIDQATITGESVPVAKGPGDPVFAATINGTGEIDVRVTRRAAESTVARIIDLVAEAQATRAPTQRVIDRFGNRYAWAVILGSLATLVIPMVALGWSFDTAFYRAMTLLVVASPCALVISTPASYLSGIANAARHRVLFKGGAYLEAAADIDCVAIDKTGTLTHGRPALTDVVALGGGSGDDLLALAASVESHSEHLIARAVVAGARERGLALAEAVGAHALPGIGIEAQVDGQTVRIVSPQHGRVDGLLEGEALRRVEEIEREAKTAMVVTNGRPVGVLAVADTPRPAAKSTLAALRAAGVRRIVMVTGDNPHVARAVAAEVGIAPDDVFAGLMPADKVGVVEQLETERRVAFVGDGVNDAPALAAASLGIAMGAGGSDVALETADVVLMGDQIERLGYVFALGRAARRIVKQNIVFSVGVIVVLVLATLLVGIPLPLGVVGHEGSTVIVVLNGLRLLGFKGGSVVPGAAPPARSAPTGRGRRRRAG